MAIELNGTGSVKKDETMEEPLCDRCGHLLKEHVVPLIGAQDHRNCVRCDCTRPLDEIPELPPAESRCELCGEPMPPGEDMFKYHGYSGPCPKPPLPREHAAQPSSSGEEPKELPVWRIEVFREEDGRFAAEYKTGDGREAGMGTYSATPIGALAELCCTLIEVDEDKAKERVAQGSTTPSEQERTMTSRILGTDSGVTVVAYDDTASLEEARKNANARQVDDPMEHELKCWPQFWTAVDNGTKTFEIRRADRPFQVGDTLVLNEFDPNGRGYTGRVTRKIVSYITNWQQRDGYIVMGLAAQGSTTPAVIAEVEESLRIMAKLFVQLEPLHEYGMSLSAVADKLAVLLPPGDREGR